MILQCAISTNMMKKVFLPPPLSKILKAPPPLKPLCLPLQIQRKNQNQNELLAAKYGGDSIWVPVIDHEA